MSVSDWSGRARCVVLGEYLAEKKTTVRQAAAVFGVSKSTVHKDVTERMEEINPRLAAKARKILDINKSERLKALDYPRYLKVKEILDFNLSERHLRGGEATRIKYSALHGRGKE